MKYQIRNKRSKKIVKEIELPMSEVDEWKKKNPTLEIVIGAPSIHSGTGLGLKSMKTDETFKNKIKQIDKTFKGNTLRQFVNI